MLVAIPTKHMCAQETNRFSTQIEAVAFDMDGLLLNTEDLFGDVFDVLLGRRGKTYRNEVRQRMIGLPAQQAFETLIEAESLAEPWRELQTETDEIFEQLLPTKLVLMPGVQKLLDRLDQIGIPRCVATSSTRAFATNSLGIVGVLDRFDFVLTAADVARGKPFPDIYEESARRMGTNPDAMLVLEDSPTGTRAGVSAGAYVVSVPNEHTKHGRFDGARWIANTLEDVRIEQLLTTLAKS